ncbi:DUF1295 domain-containing protein [Bacteroidales bacterium M08MB]|nr:DUF1295 domain-containing protein [Perlabentimonas gracilis]
MYSQSPSLFQTQALRFHIHHHIRTLYRHCNYNRRTDQRFSQLAACLPQGLWIRSKNQSLFHAFQAVLLCFVHLPLQLPEQQKSTREFFVV